MDIGREFLPLSGELTMSMNFSAIPTLKDPVNVSTTGLDTQEIASLTLVQEAFIPAVADTAWEIAGANDFNGDGKTDILWRYSGTGAFQGYNVLWFMDGPTILREALINQISDLDWRIGATGDFNGDGMTDILWRNYGTGALQGYNLIWYMDGAVRQGEVIFSQILDTAWEIAATGDFNSDGKTDILWRYYGTGAFQGINDIWYMDGVTFLYEEIFSIIADTSWRIANR